jgi:hypothetical protein
MPMNLSADLAVIDTNAVQHTKELLATCRRFADLLAAHEHAMADGVLTIKEAHELSLDAAILAVQADRLSRALEGK